MLLILVRSFTCRGLHWYLVFMYYFQLFGGPTVLDSVRTQVAWVSEVADLGVLGLPVLLRIVTGWGTHLGFKNFEMSFFSWSDVSRYRCGSANDLHWQFTCRRFHVLVFWLLLIIHYGIVILIKPRCLSLKLPREIAQAPARVFVLAFLFVTALIYFFLILHHLCLFKRVWRLVCSIIIIDYFQTENVADLEEFNPRSWNTVLPEIQNP